MNHQMYSDASCSYLHLRATDGRHASHRRGCLLPPDLLAQIQAGEAEGQSTGAFGLEGNRRLIDEIQRAFSDARVEWEAFQRRLERSRESPTTLTRQYWAVPFLEILGFRNLRPQRSYLDAGDQRYDVSHLAGDGEHAPPVHVVAIDQKLDERDGRRSPHSSVQEFLNRSDAVWGLVTNGERLRLLRDSERFTRPTYIEFDLRGIFEGNLYPEFALAYRLLHATRFPRDSSDVSESWLERYYQVGLEQGGRVREKLRDGVEAALRTLGANFLQHPGSEELRDAVRSGRLDEEEYYRQLLRLVYRLLFLMVAEERRLIFPDERDAGSTVDLYLRYYSVSALRARCERYFAGDTHHDLWLGLVQTFRIFRDRVHAEPLGLAPLDGELFGASACRDLEGALCSNEALLGALLRLSTFMDDREPGEGGRRRRPSGGIRRRVNYGALDVEEFGSVYESLLDFHPRFEFEPHPGGQPEFELVAGSERKQTGSYYTPPELVRELIELALVPVMQERLEEARTREAKIEALLGLCVLDPASGSGHFLLAAARRIAGELAGVRAGEDDPSPREFREALRDVIRHCIYAVDKNPLAVDLCKVALWIEGHLPGLPLSFLDHHVRCGDSLVGVLDLEVLSEGIPDGAYTAVAGDNKKVATAYRKRNRKGRAGQLRLGESEVPATLASSFVEAFAAIADRTDQTVEDVLDVEEAYRGLRSVDEMSRLRQACDLWTGAFFAPLRRNEAATAIEHPVPTTRDIRRAIAGRHEPREPAHAIAEVATQSTRHGFFHWPLEFPDVVLGRGGFDVVLGNPPWDTLSPDRKEFFAVYERNVRFSAKPEQDALIADLLERRDVREKWEEYEHDLYALARFLRRSGRYQLFASGNLGKGDFNLYRTFVELALRLTRKGGWSSQIVPNGLYNGANATEIRRELVEKRDLSVLLGFINTGQRWFPAVHAETRFALYAAKNTPSRRAFQAAFGISSPEELTTVEREGLTLSTVQMLSPETLAFPDASNLLEVQLAARMHQRWPRFDDDTAVPPMRHYMREVDMGNDRVLFNESDGLPVYEGRMIGQFDYRAKVYRSGRGRAARWDALDFGDDQKLIVPQWRIHRELIPDRLSQRVQDYRAGFGDVTSPNTDRSLQATLIPPEVICGHKVPTVAFPLGYRFSYAIWIAIANSFCIDFLLRQKVSLQVSYTILDSLPFPRLQLSDPATAFLGPRSLRLICTGPEMKDYWNQMASIGWCPPTTEASPPGYIDSERRRIARAEIDAYVALRIFDLKRSEFASILSTFDLLRRREVKAHGEFETQALTLSVFDEMARAMETKTPYQGRLDLPPADLTVVSLVGTEQQSVSPEVLGEE